VLIGGRKIYGSAQLAWYSAFVQSGTFLVNMDFDIMERALTPPALKFAGKTVHSIKERVTSLSREVGRELDTHEVMGRFAEHAAEMLDIHLVSGDLSPEEKALAEELLAVKYSTDEWNFGDRTDYQVMVADRNEDGVISLSADMDGRLIRKVHLSGDLLLTDRQPLEGIEHALTGHSLSEAQDIVQAAPLKAGIRESMVRLLNKIAEQIAGISP